MKKYLKILYLPLALVGVYSVLPQLGNYHQTLDALVHSSLLWLLLAVVVSVAIFLIGALIQYAAGNGIGNISDMILLQYAGSCLGHLVPFGFGGISLTSEYYRKHGQSRSESATLAILPTIFQALTTFIIVLLVSPLTVIQYSHRFHIGHLSSSAVAVLTASVLLAVVASYFLKSHLQAIWTQLQHGIQSIRSLRQVARVIIGSAAVTLASAAALYVSIKAVHGSFPAAACVVLYATSSFVGSVTPIPGGIGTTEAVLVLGLSGAGLRLPVAVAATLIYRLVTFWLPILPGALALLKLRHTKVPSKNEHPQR